MSPAGRHGKCRRDGVIGERERLPRFTIGVVLLTPPVMVLPAFSHLERNTNLIGYVLVPSNRVVFAVASMSLRHRAAGGNIIWTVDKPEMVGPISVPGDGCDEPSGDIWDLAAADDCSGGLPDERHRSLGEDIMSVFVKYPTAMVDVDPWHAMPSRSSPPVPSVVCDLADPSSSSPWDGSSESSGVRVSRMRWRNWDDALEGTTWSTLLYAVFALGSPGAIVISYRPSCNLMNASSSCSSSWLPAPDAAADSTTSVLRFLASAVELYRVLHEAPVEANRRAPANDSAPTTSSGFPADLRGTMGGSTKATSNNFIVLLTPRHVTPSCGGTSQERDAVVASLLVAEEEHADDPMATWRNTLRGIIRPAFLGVTVCWRDERDEIDRLAAERLRAKAAVPRESSFPFRSCSATQAWCSEASRRAEPAPSISISDQRDEWGRLLRRALHLHAVVELGQVECSSLESSLPMVPSDLVASAIGTQLWGLRAAQRCFTFEFVAEVLCACDDAALVMSVDETGLNHAPLRDRDDGDGQGRPSRRTASCCVAANWLAPLGFILRAAAAGRDGEIGGSGPGWLRSSRASVATMQLSEQWKPLVTPDDVDFPIWAAEVQRLLTEVAASMMAGGAGSRQATAASSPSEGPSTTALPICRLTASRLRVLHQRVTSTCLGLIDSSVDMTPTLEDATAPHGPHDGVGVALYAVTSPKGMPLSSWFANVAQQACATFIACCVDDRATNASSAAIDASQLLDTGDRRHEGSHVVHSQIAGQSNLSTGLARTWHTMLHSRIAARVYDGARRLNLARRPIGDAVVSIWEQRAPAELQRWVVRHQVTLRSTLPLLLFLVLWILA